MDFNSIFSIFRSKRAFAKFISAVICVSFLVCAWAYGQSSKQEAGRDRFKKWLDEDVVYIITEEEKAVFENLQTYAEREKFVEQFWYRRDPTPTTSYNEFKEEHYRRVQYSNDHFTSGQPGWKSDRGRIYIKFGPPDRRETHPTGGYYERPAWEGGGATNTLPFERWEYRFIDGVGDDVELEFVDVSLSGEYKLTMNPDDKDALLRIPGAGQTDAEALGASRRVDRILRRTSPMPGRNPLLTGYGRFKDQPFEKLHTFTDLQRPPTNSFRDLYRPEVLTDVHYNQLPLQLGVDAFSAGEQDYWVAVTVMVPNREVGFVATEGSDLQAVLEIYGRVSSMGGKTVKLFEETVGKYADASRLAETLKQKSMYQKSLQLSAGRYKLDLIVRDQNAESLGTQSTGIILPKLSREKLILSSLVLADRIEMAGGQAGAFGPAKVFPNLSRVFSPDQKLLVFYQVSNFQLDTASQTPDLLSGTAMRRESETVFTDEVRINQQIQNRKRLRLVHEISLEGMDPGKYTLRLTVEDQISGRQAERQVTFQVSPKS